jgi:hypothetical protein
MPQRSLGSTMLDLDRRDDGRALGRRELKSQLAVHDPNIEALLDRLQRSTCLSGDIEVP